MTAPELHTGSGFVMVWDNCELQLRNIKFRDTLVDEHTCVAGGPPGDMKDDDKDEESHVSFSLGDGARRGPPELR